MKLHNYRWLYQALFSMWMKWCCQVPWGIRWVELMWVNKTDSISPSRFDFFDLCAEGGSILLKMVHSKSPFSHLLEVYPARPCMKATRWSLESALLAWKFAFGICTGFGWDSQKTMNSCFLSPLLDYPSKMKGCFQAKEYNYLDKHPSMSLKDEICCFTPLSI